MRIRGLAVPIAIVALLIILGGVMAGLVMARDQAPRTSTPEAAVSHTESSLRTGTQSNHWEQAASTPGVFAEGEKDRRKEADQGQTEALALPEKTQFKYPDLGSRLDQLVTTVEAEQATAEEAARDAAVHSGASVAVTIHLSGNVDAVVSFLEANGGDPRNVGEDYIEAYVPMTLLGAVSEQPGVVRVREIVLPEPGRGG